VFMCNGWRRGNVCVACEGVNRCDSEWHFEGFGLSSDVVSEVVWLGCVGCGSAGYQWLRVWSLVLWCYWLCMLMGNQW